VGGVVVVVMRESGLGSGAVTGVHGTEAQAARSVSVAVDGGEGSARSCIVARVWWLERWAVVGW